MKTSILVTYCVVCDIREDAEERVDLNVTRQCPLWGTN